MRVTFRAVSVLSMYAFSCVSYRALFSSALFAPGRSRIFFLARSRKRKGEKYITFRKQYLLETDRPRRCLFFSARVIGFAILRHRLKMKPVDRRNRFPGEGCTFFSSLAANAHATFSVPPPPPATLKIHWNRRGDLIFPKTRTPIRSVPSLRLRFFSRASRRSSRPSLFPSCTSIWIGRLNRPVPGCVTDDLDRP